MTEINANLARLRAKPRDACVSDLEIDRLVTREVAGAEAASLRARIQACAHCRERLETLEAGYRSFRARPAKIAFSTAGRTPKPAWLGAGVLTAAAAAMFFLASPSKSPSGVIRLKGGERFDYMVVTPDGRIRGDPTSGIAHPGDELQWRFRVFDDRYVAVLSRGEDGQVSVYYPRGERAARVAGGGEHVMPTAARLDETKNGRQREELVGFVCTKPVRIPSLQAELQKTSPSFPSACSIHRHTLTVRERR